MYIACASLFRKMANKRVAFILFTNGALFRKLIITNQHVEVINANIGIVFFEQFIEMVGLSLGLDTSSNKLKMIIDNLIYYHQY